MLRLMPVERQEVMHHRFLRPDVEAQRLLLQIGVGVRHPLVLPQVLRQDSTRNHSMMHSGSPVCSVMPQA